MWNVLYTEPVPGDVEEVVRQQLPPNFNLVVVGSRDRDELIERVATADFLLTATARIDEAVLANAPRLRLIQHQGVGYDNVDVEAARRRGVPVGTTPEGTTVGVAEHTILLMLAVYKQLPRAHNALKEGRWLQWELRTTSFELAGKQLGLVGFGRIGREVARRARAFDMRVAYYDPYRAPEDVEHDLGVRYLPLPELLGSSDIVSVHVPYSAATHHLIGREQLAQMKPSAVLINTSRGGLVDELALVEALRERRIWAAGLDVFSQEPIDPDNPLLGLDHVVLTPHVAAGTRDALVQKMRAAFANMVRVVRGEEPRNRVV
jgi:D-3-phosphoglycerate dehydrogenase